MLFLNYHKPSVDPLEMLHGPLGMQGTPFGETLVYKIEIVNKIEIFYFLLVSEDTQ